MFENLSSAQRIKAALKRYYPLLAILIGVVLISTVMGPYQTLDTNLEFNTTQGVLRWGYPYLDRFGAPNNASYGDLFNMPPLGFYTQAAYFTLVPASEQNGVALITLFGLACIVAIYALGKLLYNQTTGLFAAALFGLAPWQLILSRAFLIDTQSLLLSLVCLYLGILAIKKDSVKYALASGFFFAAAFMTKQFAVFVLIPLLLLYIYHKPTNLKMIIGQLTAFGLPAVASSLIWYQGILGKGLLYLFNHNDFRDLNFPNITPSYSFLNEFLINYGLGIVFVCAVVFSVISGALIWRHLSKDVVFVDIVCLITILLISGLVVYMGVILNLKAPYTSAIKYAYQALPYFSLLAASLVIKSSAWLKSAEKTHRLKKIVYYGFGFAGVCLLFFVLVASLCMAQQLATTSYLIMRVQPGQDIGYAFHVDHPLSQGSPLLWFQVLGFLVILSGMVWEERKKISGAFKHSYRLLATR